MTEKKHEISPALRVGVFFGSTSDQKIAMGLLDSLCRTGFEAELHYISAHRNADELVRQLKRDAYDLYIAGAGLAAHLPGVIASHTHRPVFGVPVNGALGGLDALLSIVQMPAGVPVISCGVEKTEVIPVFLQAMLSPADHVHLSWPEFEEVALNSPEFKNELSRAISVAEESGIKMSHGRNPVKGAINVVCIDIRNKGAAMPSGTFPILVPWLDADHKKKAESALILAQTMNAGGLWVGLNNLRNGILAANRIIKLRKAEMLIYRGSVKDVLGGGDRDGLIFEYSDRYSVFDWGPMPDEITGKGEALATIADQVFRNVGIPHHSLGLMPGRPRCLSVKKVDVKWPQKNNSGWDYSQYATQPVDCLVPLEVIFRFGVPVGSSLPSRLASNPDYMKSLGFGEPPTIGAEFAEPVIEFSTKLEDSDRYVAVDEARSIAGMTEAEIARLRELAKGLAVELKTFFTSADLKLWDGKFEFAFIKGNAGRNFMLVDSVGPDELRLTHDGVQISKEILRQFYADGPWHAAIGRAKKIAAGKPEIDWRSLCANDMAQRPVPLTPEVRKIAENIYPAIANSLARVKGDRPPFPAAWDLSQLVARVREEGLA